MIYFPLTVLDDVFVHPQQVLDLAKSVEYEKPLGKNYPGVASNKQLQEIDTDLAMYVLQTIMSPFWDPRDHVINFNSLQDFQKIIPHSDKDSLFNKGLIHTDNNRGQLATAIIYLNDCENGGTSFWRRKRNHYITGSTVPPDYLQITQEYHRTGIVTDELEQKLIEHRNKFDETMRVEAKAGRMVIFPADIWHSQTTYGTETRYTLRTFLLDAKVTIGNITEKPARWPMQRLN